MLSPRNSRTAELILTKSRPPHLLYTTSKSVSKVDIYEQKTHWQQQTECTRIVNYTMHTFLNLFIQNCRVRCDDYRCSNLCALSIFCSVL